MSRNRAAKLLADAYSVLRRPIMTEKSHDMYAEGTDNERKRYTFEVHIKANKQQIRNAVQSAFGVQVESVNTIIVKPRRKAFRGASMGKSGFSRQRKKAIIRLTKDSKQIELI